MRLSAAPVLVHDYLLVMRGAERTFAAIADMFPAAPVAALLYDGNVFDERLAGHPIRTSALQALNLDQRNYRKALPLMPRAVAHLDVSGSDLVVSSSSAFAHGVRLGQGVTHVCYCHTPFRYAWYARAAGLRSAPRALRAPVSVVLEQIRRWDFRAAQDGTHYVANSKATQQRIQDCWGIDAALVHPPVEVDRFAPGTREDFALIVGELVVHKRIGATIEAALRAGVPVKVVGEGAEGARLRAQFGDSVEFLGRLDDEELASVYGRARALLIGTVEEFGITAVEAQAAGCPVIAINAGGVLETVVDGLTGYLVDTLDDFSDILAGDDLDRLPAAAMVENSKRFTVEVFQRRMHDQIALAREPQPVAAVSPLAAA